MKLMVILVSAAGCMFGPMFAVQASAADALDEIRALWSSNRFDEVVSRVAQRDKEYGRTAELDYMIGTSACKIGLADTGLRYLMACLSYDLSDEDRAGIEQAKTRCGQSAPPARLTWLVARNGQVGVEGRLKTYTVLPTNAVIKGTVLETVRKIPLEEIRKRRLKLADSATGVEQGVKVAGTNFVGKAFGRFVVVGQAGSVTPEVGRLLQKYEEFFRSEYGLALPELLVTVYLAPTLVDLHMLAASLHGFKLPSQCIGYSQSDDLSLIVLDHSGPNNGTLCHELFHLAARSTFGDIPAWLDEGMAALYETSAITTDRIEGRDNWRRSLLEQDWSMRPPLGELVGMESKLFSNADPQRQAINEATARYLLLFLQERRQLSLFFNAFRLRKPEDLRVGSEESLRNAYHRNAIELVEKTLGMPIQQLDQEYGAWFRRR